MTKKNPFLDEEPNPFLLEDNPFLDVGDEGATKAFFRGARSMVQGVGRTAGIVSPEDYAETYRKGKEAAQAHPIASGLGQVAGVAVPTIGAAILAPASVPLAATALAAVTSGTMLGGSEYARLGEEGATPLERLQGADLASDIGTAGVLIPGGFGTTLGSRVVTGVGSNVALGGGQRAIERDIIHPDRPDLQPEVFDPMAVGFDVAGGTLGGVATHVGAPKGVKPQVDEVPDVPADRGFTEQVQAARDNAEKTIQRSEYLIKEIDKDLNTKTFESPEQTEQYKAARMEERAQHISDIEEMARTIQKADEMLSGETLTPRETSGEMPSGLPPRPQGEDFVRQETASIPAEQAVQADLFDQPVRAEELPQELRPEPFRTDSGQTSGEIGTGIPTTEEITLQPLQQMDDIEFLSKEEAQTRLDNLDYSAEGSMQIAHALGAHIKQLEPADPIQIKGATKAEETAIREILDEVGLGREEIDMDISAKQTDMRPDSQAEANAIHNTGYVKVGNEEIIRGVLDKLSERGKRLFQDMSPEQQIQFTKLWNATHEIGHILLAKLVQNRLWRDKTLKLADDYEVWMKQDPSRAGGKGSIFSNAPVDVDYYAKFPEFFAQRVAKVLLLGEKAPQGAIRDFVMDMSKVWRKLRARMGLPVRMNHFVDDFIMDVVVANKESLAKTGETLFEMKSTHGTLQDAFAWQNAYFPKDKPDAPRPTITPSMQSAVRHIEAAEAILEQQSHVKDINPTSSSLIHNMINQAMLKGGNWLFGIQQKAQFYKNSPMVRYAADTILNAIHTQTSRSMELLTGAPSRAAWNAKNKIMVSLQKVKDNDSFSVIADKSSNEDFHAVHQVLEVGIGKYSYEESLVINGANFTPQQRTLFDAITKMYAKIYDMAEKSATDLGKKSIVPNMNGWYPAVRKGEFTVNFRVKGLNRIAGRDDLGRSIMTDLVHSQSFRTKGEAQAFIDHFEKQSPEFKGKLEHDGIQQYKDADMPNNMAEFMEAYKAQRAKLESELGAGVPPKWLEQELAEAGGDIQKVLDARMQRMTDMYIARGGTLGAHHRLRTNVSGSMGSEMFSTVHDAGKAFRNANFKSVDEYTSLMMKSEIEEKLNLMLDKPEFLESHPNTIEVVTLMRDYALNKVESPFQMKGFKASVDAVWEQAWKKTPLHKMEVFGAKQYHDAPTVDLALGKASHFFYIHALMSRPAFWAAQGVQFLWAGRTMVKDGVGPIGAMTAAGKGFWSVLHPDRQFLDALFEVSQTSHTFSPQFINDLNKFGLSDLMKEGGKGKLIFDLITGEKQSTMADTFSRLMSFGMMYEHFRSKGLTGSDLAQAAAKATDENMVQYGRQYKAPIFQKAGVVGDLTSPLQTFSQAALGNILADISDIVQAPGGKAKLKASLPFMATMAITSLMAGVIGAPLVAEYEALRLLINALGRKVGYDDDLLPSVIDLVLQGDNTFSNRVLSHGLISTATMPATDGEGLDIAASNRWQPIWGGIMTGEKTFMESIPVVNFVLDRLDDTTSIIKYRAGITEMTDAERRTHVLGIVPGMYKGLVDDIMYGAGDREFVPTNKGQAFLPQTDVERASRYLGTSTINASTQRLRERRTREQEMRDQEVIDKKIEMITDAALKEDSEKVVKLARELAEEYQMDSEQIERRVKSSIFKRKVPSGVRQFVGQSGQPSTQQQKRLQYYSETYEDNPFLQEQAE